jgi:hypothetical protein
MVHVQRWNETDLRDINFFMLKLIVFSFNYEMFDNLFNQIVLNALQHVQNRLARFLNNLG